MHDRTHARGKVRRDWDSCPMIAAIVEQTGVIDF